MRKLILAIIVCLPVWGFCQTSEESISAVLNLQSQAWNKGDVDEFMNYYWKNEEVTFVSKNGVTKGWQKVYNNYKKGYPDKAAMGKLTFDHLVFEKMNPKAYVITGSWLLEYDTANGEERQNTGGWFTLIFKKFGKDWRIVYDHTS